MVIQVLVSHTLSMVFSHHFKNKLLETEVIFKEDLEIIFGKRPFEKEVVRKEEKTKKTEDDTKTSSKKSA